MQNLEKKIFNTIKKSNLIENGDKIVLGVSGGPDSICMLNVLINLYKKDCKAETSKKVITDNMLINNKLEGPSPVAIVVAHVNHMIREEATEDEKYVEDFCKKNNIEFYSKSIDVLKIANNNKIGTEEAGRIERYKFFEEVLKKTGSNKIAVAHNKNDKVETIFLNILRGSGLEGLKGIEPKRGNIIRPLIECERDEIEQYCMDNNLDPRIDKTNFENIYNRNKIRNTVIPYIKTQWNPNIINTIDRLSNIAILEDEYMNNQVEKIYKEILIQEGQNKKEIIINLKKFNLQEKVIKSRLIRYIIKEIFGSKVGIEKTHIDDIIKLCANNIGNKYLTPNKNLKVLVKNHKIFFTKQI